MNPVKVVIAGPFGAGKTTFIRTISEITVLETEQPITDGSASADKPSTTVGIDYGRITLAQDLVLCLFGTPGQERFDFMWEVASRGMLGFILVVDYARPESFREASSILGFFGRNGRAPFIVAVNKGTGSATEREIVGNALGIGDGERIVSVDALERQSVKETLIAFLEFLLATLEDRVAV